MSHGLLPGGFAGVPPKGLIWMDVHTSVNMDDPFLFAFRRPELEIL
jgi:hypothetical protein